MKSGRKALGVLIVALLCAVSFPFSGADKDTESYPFLRDTAWGAEDQNYLKEPFSIEPQRVPDPLERINRGFFKFNDKFYFWVLKPVSIGYKTFVPLGVRVCIRNAFNNVVAPVRIVNNTLQGKFEATGIEVSRFIINSTLGFAGFFDFASTEFNLQPRYEDTGLTLGHYGMKPIMYIDWPILGPSDIRDSLGLIADTFLNPLTYVGIFLAPLEVSAGIQTEERVNATSLRIGEYEDFKKSALDPYVSMRDGYLQYRAKQISK